ncbi:hypothetical protein WR25_05217 [Diploscapter pachys]|uniref:Uncharacterized protein n=1 Tax=Diploscapter pachys TaxID=2018661 RepID=A0A2A2K1I1_9BILA|nr:hypothetical protein WR25_05217 [Diploscapter pachys]
MPHRRQHLDLAIDIGAHAAAGRRVDLVDVDDPHRSVALDRAEPAQAAQILHADGPLHGAAADIDDRLIHLWPRHAELPRADEAGTVLKEVELVLAVAVVRDEQRIAAGARHADADVDRAAARRIRPDAAEGLALGDEIVVVLQEIRFGRRIQFQLNAALAVLQARHLHQNRRPAAGAARRGIAAQHLRAGRRCRHQQCRGEDRTLGHIRRLHTRFLVARW